MSSRIALNPFPVVTNASMAADVISAVTICAKMSKVNYEFVWTGNATGTFQIETSDSYALNPDGTVKNAGSWTPVPTDSSVGPGGASGNGIIALNEMPGYALRAHFVRSGGTGTLNVIVNGKVS